MTTIRPREKPKHVAGAGIEPAPKGYEPFEVTVPPPRGIAT